MRVARSCKVNYFMRAWKNNEVFVVLQRKLSTFWLLGNGNCLAINCAHCLYLRTYAYKSRLI